MIQDLGGKKQNTDCNIVLSSIGTPHNITWGLENRNTMIRVIARGAGKATYFENRSPGAAMNPYLGLAATGCCRYRRNTEQARITDRGTRT
jgi:Glutamine synthetase